MCLFRFAAPLLADEFGTCPVGDKNHPPGGSNERPTQMVLEWVQINCELVSVNEPYSARTFDLGRP